MAGNRQQSRFLALVSNYDRLKELSEEAANAEDAATLQVLKTMDSVSAKAQQLQTSIQSLYTEGGLEILYKGILDLATQIIDTFNGMPKLFDRIPVVAIATFGSMFTNIGGLLKLAISQGSEKISELRAALEGKLKEGAESGANEAKKAIDDVVEYGIKRAADLGQAMADGIAGNTENIATAPQGFSFGQVMSTVGVTDEKLLRRINGYNENLANGKTTAAKHTLENIQKMGHTPQTVEEATASQEAIVEGNDKLQESFSSVSAFYQAHSKQIGIALRSIGVAAQSAALMISDDNRGLKGALTAVGGLASAAGQWMTGNYVGAVLTGITTIINTVDILVETTEEKIARLKKEQQDAQNKVIQSKDEVKTLEEYRQKLETLTAARNDSTEAYQEWLNLNNEIAAKFPSLISQIDSEGNSIVELTGNYERLLEIKQQLYRQNLIEQGGASLNVATDYDALMDQLGISWDDFIENSATSTTGLDDIISNLMKLNGDTDKLAQETTLLDNQRVLFKSDYAGFIGAPDEDSSKTLKNFNKDIIELFMSNANATAEDILEILGKYVELEENPDINDYFDTSVLQAWKTAFSAFSFYFGQSDNIVKQSIGEILKITAEMEHWDISSIAMQSLQEQAFNEWQNYVIEQKKINPDAKINDLYKNWSTELTFTVGQKYADALDKYFENIDEETQAALEDLYNNANQYNLTNYQQQIAKILGVSIDNVDASLWDVMLKHFNESRDQMSQKAADAFKFIGRTQKRENWIKDTFSNNEIPLINTQFANINESITTDYAQWLYNNIKDLTDEQRKILLSSDLSLWSGASDLKAALQAAGLEEDNGLWDILAKIPFNINTEVNTYINSITQRLTDFEKALTNAQKGLSFKDASEMAQQMGVTLDNFELKNGKFFIKDINGITQGYLKLKEDLEQEITYYNSQFDAQLFEQPNEGFKSFFDNLYDQKSLFDLFSLEELKSQYKQNPAFSFLSSEQIDQAFELYHQYLDDFEAQLSQDGGVKKLSDYIRQKTEIDDETLAQYNALLDYIDNLTNIAYISTGQLDKFFESIEIDDKTVQQKIASAIATNNFSDLEPDILNKIIPYFSNLREAIGSAQSSFLDGMFDSITKGPQLISTTTESQKKLAESLEGYDWVKVLRDNGEITDIIINASRENLDAIIDWYTKNANDLTAEQRAQYQDVIAELKSPNKVAALQGVAQKNVSRSSLKAYMEAFGYAVDQIDQAAADLGLVLDEATGEYRTTGATIEELRTRLLEVANPKDQKIIQAQINALEHQDDIDRIKSINDVLNNAAAVTDEQLGALASNLGWNLDSLIEFYTQYNSETGTYTLDTTWLLNTLHQAGRITDEQFAQYTASIASNALSLLSNIGSIQSKGTTDLSAMQSTVDSINQELDVEFNINDIFGFDTILQAYTYSAEGIEHLREAAVKRAKQLNVADADAMANRIVTEQLLGGFSVDNWIAVARESSVNVDHTSTRALTTMKEQFDLVQKTIGLTWDEFITNIAAGGDSAVQAMQQVYEAQGKTLSTEEVEALYNSKVNDLVKASEQLHSSVGSIVDATAAKLLSAAGATLTQIEGTDTYRITMAADAEALVNACKSLYEQLATEFRKGVGNIADLNKAGTDYLNEIDKSSTQTIALLKNGPQMSWNDLEQYFNAIGADMVEELKTPRGQAKYGVKKNGFGGVDIVNLQNFLKGMNLGSDDTSSREYLEALRSWNDAIVQKENQAISNLQSEIGGLKDLSVGEKLNITELNAVLGASTKAALTNLGLELNDGILTVLDSFTGSTVDILSLVRADLAAKNTDGKYTEIIQTLTDAISSTYKTAINDLAQYSQGMAVTGTTAQLLASRGATWAQELKETGQITFNTIQDYQAAVLAIYEQTQAAVQSGIASLSDANDAWANVIKSNMLQSTNKMDLLKSAQGFNIDAFRDFAKIVGVDFTRLVDASGQLTKLGELAGFKDLGNGNFAIDSLEQFDRVFAGVLDKRSHDYIEAYADYLESQTSNELFMSGLIQNLNSLSYSQIELIAKQFNMTMDEVMAYMRQNADGSYNAHALINNLDFDKNNEQWIKLTTQQFQNLDSSFTDALINYATATSITGIQQSTFDQAVKDYVEGYEALGLAIDIDQQQLQSRLRAGGADAVSVMQQIMAQHGQALSADQVSTVYRAAIERYVAAIDTIGATVGSIIDETTANLLIRAGGQVQQIANTDSYVVVSAAVHLCEAYRQLYHTLANSTEATIDEINKAGIQLLQSEDNAGGRLDAVEALKNAYGMSWEALGEIFTKQGKDLYKELSGGGFADYGIERLWNGTVNITDFNKFASKMGWQPGGRDYQEAFKSYNDAAISYRRQIIDSITSEVSGLKDFAVGSQFNVTDLSTRLTQSTKDALEKIGLSIENGILTVLDSFSGDTIGAYQAIRNDLLGQNIQGQFTEIIKSLNDSISAILTTASNDLSKYDLGMKISGSTAQLLASVAPQWNQQLQMYGDIVITSIEEYQSAVMAIYEATANAFHDTTASLSTLNAAWANVINANTAQSKAKMSLLSSASSFDLSALQTFADTMQIRLKSLVDSTGALTGEGKKAGLESIGIGQYKIADWDAFRSQFLGVLDSRSQEYIDAYIAYLESSEDSKINSDENFFKGLMTSFASLSYAQIGAIAKQLNTSVEFVMQFLSENTDGTYNANGLLPYLEANNLRYSNEIFKMRTKQAQQIDDDILSAIETYINSDHLPDDTRARDTLKEAIEQYTKQYQALGESRSIFTDRLPTEPDQDDIFSILDRGGQAAVVLLKDILKLKLSPEQIEKFYHNGLQSYYDAIEQVSATIGTFVNGNARAAIEAGGGAVDENGMVTRAATNVSDAYQLLLDTILQYKTNATLEDLNNLQARILETQDTDIDAISVLGDAMSMTYTRLAEILTQANVQLTQELVDELKNNDIIQTIGNGKFRITDFSAFAKLMNWAPDSEEYTSAFKTYNDSLIELNNKTQRNIQEEIGSLESAKGGDWINLTELSQHLMSKIVDAVEYNAGNMSFGSDITTALEVLSAKLAVYGGSLQDGILKLDADANIPAIIATLIADAQEYGGLLESDVTILADTLRNVLQTFADAISKGIKGELSNSDALDLQNSVKGILGKDIELDFTTAGDGLKLTKDSAIELYQALENVDRAAASLVFDDLVESLTEAGNGLENISETSAKIAEIQRQIATNEAEIAEIRNSRGSHGMDEEANISALQAQNAELRQQLDLLYQIQVAQADNPDSYKFMDRNLPNYLQGPQNYWNAVGDAYTAMNNAASSGYIGIQDFYNIVNEMANLATISGSTLEFMGQEIDGKAETTAALIEKGMSALSNIDGKGVKIDLSKFGMDISAGAASMSKGFDEGIHEMAASQIKMLDAAIAMLEVIVQMEGLSDLDVGGEAGHLDLGEIFNSDQIENITGFSEGYSKWADQVLKAAETNTDLDTALKQIKVNGHTMKELLAVANKDIEDQMAALSKLGITVEQYQAVIDAFYQAYRNGNYDLESILSSVSEILGESFTNTGATITVDVGDGITVVVGGKAGLFQIEWDEASTQAAMAQFEGSVEEQKEALITAFTAYNNNTMTATQLKAVLIAKGIVTIKNDKISIDGQEYEDWDSAIEAGAIQAAMQRQLPTPTEIIDDGSDKILHYTTEQGVQYEIVLHQDGQYEYKWGDITGSSIQEVIEKSAKATADEEYKNQKGISGNIEINDADPEYVQIYKTILRQYNLQWGQSHGTGLQLTSADPKALADLTASAQTDLDQLIDDAQAKVQEAIDNAPPDAKTIEVEIHPGVKATITPDSEGSFDANSVDVAGFIQKIIDPEGLATNIATGITTAFETDAVTTAISNAIAQGIRTALTASEPGQSQSISLDGTTFTASGKPTIKVEDVIIDTADENATGVTVEEIKAHANQLIITGVDDVSMGNDTDAENKDASSINIPSATGTIDDLTITSIASSHYDDTLTLTQDIAEGSANITNLNVSASNFNATGTLMGLQTLNFSTTSSSLSQLASDAQKLTNINFDNFADIATALAPAQAAIETIWTTIQNFGNKTFNVTVNTTTTTSRKTKVNLDTDEAMIQIAALQSAIGNAVSGLSGLKQSLTETQESLSTAVQTANASINTISTAIGSIPDVSKKADGVSAMAGALGGFSNMSSVASSLGDMADALSGMPSGHKSYDVTFKYSVSKANAVGNIGAFATGNADALARGRRTLMGELGPELVVSHGRYFVVGQNGAEFVNLDKDAIVFNHKQTQRLVNQGAINSRGKPFTSELNAISLAKGRMSISGLAQANSDSGSGTKPVEPIPIERISGVSVSPLSSVLQLYSYAKGNVGPAMASAAAALAALKQLRAMWQSLLGASAKDLGALAGKGGSGKGKGGGGGKGGDGGGGGGGGGSQEDLFQPTAATMEIQRWYNLLRQIERLEEDISYQEELQNLLLEDRVANGDLIYDSYKKQLDYLDGQITRQKQLLVLQQSWLDNRVKELEDPNKSVLAKVFQYDAVNRILQYRGDDSPESGFGLDILEHLNRRDINGKPLDDAETAQKQLAYLEQLGLDLSQLLYNDDGTMIAIYDATGQLIDAATHEYLEGEELAGAQTAMVENFFDLVQGEMDEIDSLQESIDETSKSILEEEASANELLKKLIDNQLAVEQAVFKAIESREKQHIDEMKNERDALDKTQKDFLDGLNDSLQRERDMYNKAEQDQELVKLQRQLAILQRSGGSASQIKNLQDQINTKQRDAYFEAQQEQISAIQDASDKELERLDAQIDLMNEALEYQKAHGLLWSEVYSVMSLSRDEIADFITQYDKTYLALSTLDYQQKVIELLDKIGIWTEQRDDVENGYDVFARNDAHNWTTFTDAFKDMYSDIWEEEQETAKQIYDEQYAATGDSNIADAAAHAYLAQKAKERLGITDDDEGEITMPVSHGTTYSDIVGHYGENSTNQNQKDDSHTGSFYTGTTTYQNPATGVAYSNSKRTTPSTATTSTALYNDENLTSLGTYLDKGEKYVLLGFTRVGQKSVAMIGIQRGTEPPALYYANYNMGLSNPNDVTFLQSGSLLQRFASGGLIDYTGPAWVDGSRSHPEGIFDAETTSFLRNDFINGAKKLDNTVSDLTILLSQITNPDKFNGLGASDTVNIEQAQVIMNVESIANDYDAQRAGEMALDEMLKIARKSGTIGMIRR